MQTKTKIKANLTPNRKHQTEKKMKSYTKTKIIFKNVYRKINVNTKQINCRRKTNNSMSKKYTSKYKYKHEKKTKCHNTQTKIDIKQILLC